MFNDEVTGAQVSRLALTRYLKKLETGTEAIDTEPSTCCAMWQMVGVLAELERSLIVERTRAGVKAAQKRGVKFGQKPKLTPDRLTHARKLIEQGMTPTQAAKMIGVSRATLYRYLQSEAIANVS